MTEDQLRMCESFRNREFTVDDKKYIFVTLVERYSGGIIHMIDEPDALLLDISQNPPVLVSMPLNRVFEAIENQTNP